MKPPQRLRLSRRRGARLVSPDSRPVVNVTRSTKWGNPFRLPEKPTEQERAQVVARFARELRAGKLAFTVDDVRRELRGRHLACWCSLDERCHADVLLEIANG